MAGVTARTPTTKRPLKRRLVRVAVAGWRGGVLTGIVGLSHPPSLTHTHSLTPVVGLRGPRASNMLKTR